jgi:hypothetical protein
MSKATNALSVLKKNLSIDDLIELRALINFYLEQESQKGMKKVML